ncbi:MAG: NAD(P)H-dependent oxidoreductase [Lachnospiraceae bacterium]|nr:NAD(P)H-dependent oxidoreductase [Lachnospiraceae bacterium]
MSTAIVYYSLNGNTDYAAKEIAKELSADCLRLEPEKAYPTSGFAKFFRGGGSAVMGEKPALKPYTFDAAAYDTVIFGFPVWAARVTPPLRTFVEEQKTALTGKRIAAFACQSGNGAQKAFPKLLEALGIPAFAAELVLIDPKDKPAEENASKIHAFCEALK